METTVFIVEDNKDIREVLEQVLSEEGFTVRHVPEAQSALAVLNAGFVPDVIVLDLLMPHMSGEDMIQILARDYPRIPVIVCSAKRVIPSLPHVRAVIYKPFSLSMLVSAIQDVLRGSCKSRRLPHFV